MKELQLRVASYDYAAFSCAARPATAESIIRHLDRALPELWCAGYRCEIAVTADLKVLRLEPVRAERAFCRYLFHQASADETASLIEDRVIAVWAVSGPSVPAGRDEAHMRGFLRGVWSKSFPNMDRGHFFAHSLGGGLDINLFPKPSVSIAAACGGKWKTIAFATPALSASFGPYMPTRAGHPIRSSSEYSKPRLPDLGSSGPSGSKI